MSYLVDTNVLSELARTKPNAQVVAWLRDHEAQLYLSTITIGELRRGIEHLPAGKRKTSLQSWFSGLRKQLSFSIPFRHRDYHISVASVARAATARGQTKGTERDQGY